MKNFISGAIKKSRTSLSILVLLGLSGVFALNYLPKATEPDVNFPGAFVGFFTKEFHQKIQKDYWQNHLRMP